MILYLILGIIIIAIGASFYFMKPSFEVQKSRLINIYSSILSDMNVDYRDNTIGAENIINISHSILNYISEIEKMTEGIKSQTIENKKWLTDIITEFNTNLQLWIDRHASELISLDMSIAQTQTKNISEKSALELASKRLENHIQILQKI